MKDEIKITFPGKILDYVDTKEHLLELFNYITNLQERCEYLERSNNRREDEIMSLRDECVDGETYKSRNEKAIEYIKSLCYIESKNEWFTYGDDLSPKHIVNILNGGDEDGN